jgi:two-component system chemotaxis response regulator CheB
VVVAEDSPTVRRLLVETLNADPSVRVVGEARDGQEAVELVARLAPDVVTMDIEMPVMDGLEATREIMARTPTPIVIVSALASTSEGDLTFEATRAGALSVLPKPQAPDAPAFARQRDQLIAMVKAMAAVKVVRRRPKDDDAVSRAAVGARPIAPASVSGRVRLLAIAASTGGPPALRELLAGLPLRFPVPILIVQHIARGFAGALVHWLRAETGHPVMVPAHGDVALPGHAYVAPDDHHLGIARASAGRFLLTLSQEPPVGGFRPSATATFESAARVAGDGLVAVMLTGMGSDGVAGLRSVHAHGGHIVAQDEESSVIYGMPREAARTGLVDAVLPLSEIARHLASRTAADT